MFRRLKVMVRYPLAGVLTAGLALAAMVAGTGAASAATPDGHTIGSAGTLAIGKKDSGGGGAVDFWKVHLTGGDQVQLTTAQPGSGPNGNNVYYYELFPPGTNDSNFPQTAPVSSTNTPYASTKSVLFLQAPYTATFILAVCQDISGDCRNVDSNGGANPMQAYTFTPTLVNGGIKPSVGARETRASDTISKAPTMPAGNFEAGGGTPVDFWKVHLLGGDQVQLATAQPGSGADGNNVYYYELFPPGTNDTNLPQTSPVSSTNTAYASTKDTIYLQAPYNGTFVLAVCVDISGDCRNVDSGGGENPIQPYTFTDTLVGGGVRSSVGARETRAADTISKAPTMPAGNFEAGGGTPVDFWKVHLFGGDKVQLTTAQPGSGADGNNVYYYELFPPGTNDTNFPQKAPVAATATPYASSKATLELQAPSTGTFVLAVCVDISGDCRNVDSGGGENPMQPYTFTDILLGGHHTTTTLKLSSSTVTSGKEKSLSLSVKVAEVGSKTVPGGTVTITAGQKTVCTVTLSKGTGKCSPSSNTLLAPGSYSLVAAYGGARNLYSSRSAAQKLTVKKG